MKENEKRNILILTILSIVIIVVLVMVFKPYKKKNSEVINEQTTQQQINQNANSQRQENNKQGNNTQTGEFVKTNDLGEKVNISEKINTTKETEGLVLSNVSLKEANGETKLICRITNKNEKEQEGFFGNIVLLDKTNQVVGKIPIKVSTMKAKETREVKASITESFANNAYDYRLEK